MRLSSNTAILRTMRRRIREILHIVASDDKAAKWVNACILTVIALNVVASVLETEVTFASRWQGELQVLEVVSVVLFSIELCLRVWTATESRTPRGAFIDRCRYLVKPVVLVDIAAILPFYLTAFLPGAFDLRFLRALRMLRALRLLRAGRIAIAFATLGAVLKSKRADFVVALTILLVVLLLSASAIYFAEHELPNSKFTSIPRSLWWAVVTVSTVGYGDMTPEFGIGQLVGGIVVFSGICVLALPVGIITAGYMDELNTRRDEKASDAANSVGLPMPESATKCPCCHSDLSQRYDS